MKNLITFSVLFLININLFAQNAPSWVYGDKPQKKNHVYFKADESHISKNTAKIKARLDIFEQVATRSGITISKYQRDSIETVIKNNDDVEEKEVIKSIIEIFGKKIQIIGLTKSSEWSKIDNDGKYHQWYLYELSELHVGNLAFVPTAAQFKRKENGKVVGLLGLEALAIGSGAYFANQAKYYHQQLQLQTTNLTLRNQVQDSERAARTISIISYVGGTGLFYLISTLDGISKNNKRNKKNEFYSLKNSINLMPYYATTHSGLTLSIALNK